MKIATGKAHITVLRDPNDRTHIVLQSDEAGTLAITVGIIGPERKADVALIVDWLQGTGKQRMTRGKRTLSMGEIG